MERARALAELLREAVADERVLDAIAAVPREAFVPESERRRAYDNIALPIDCGQTISQPLVVARMLELLQLAPTDRVLDVGTGSGYHAALLARLVAHVWSVERHLSLVVQARRTLRELSIENVTCVGGDGGQGLPDEAPFQAINVAAATGPQLPPALLAQLDEGGRLVAPLGSDDQRLIVARRQGGTIRHELLERVRFVPLVRDPDPARPPREPGPQDPGGGG
jgi:protein-L-isoaspartate(D-aspartate) O-methyltransferase